MPNITTMIIILSFVAIGMVLGLLFRPKDEYHGPNAINESKKKYFDTKTNKCLKFGIKSLECPKSKTKMQKIWNTFIKIFFPDRQKK